MGQDRLGSIRSMGPPKFGDNVRPITRPPNLAQPITFGQKETIKAICKRFKEMLVLREQQGKARAAAAELPRQFGDDARFTRLPHQTIPPPPRPPYPGRTVTYRQWQEYIQERDQRANKEILQRQDPGRARAAAAERPRQFGDDARTTRLPHQTIASPNTRC